MATIKPMSEQLKMTEWKPYYYQKSSTPIIPMGLSTYQDQLDLLAQHAVDNKNPLNLFLPGQNFRDAAMEYLFPLDEWYRWPIPFCFSWPQYRENSEGGVTLWRIAKDFWSDIEKAKPGLRVFAAELFLLPAGKNTERVGHNPGGPSTYTWFVGGACRLHIPLITNNDVVFDVGPESQHLEQYRVYEVNNRMVHQIRNEGTTDHVYLNIDLVPQENTDELEQRLLSHPIVRKLHVTQSAGFPAVTTAFL